MKGVLTFSVLMQVSLALSSNILLISTNSLSSPSHFMVLSTVTGGLVSKGHNVTLVSNDVKKTAGFPNGTYSQALFCKATYSQDQADANIASVLQMAFRPTGIRQMVHFVEALHTNYLNCHDLWEDTQVVKRLKYSSEFDLMLVFPFSSCDILMAHYLNVPFVVVFPSIRAPPFHEGYIGMPYPSSYVPFNVFGTSTDEMTFVERLLNLFYPLLYDVMQFWSNTYYYDIQKQFNIHPDKSIKQLYQKASLFLAHISLSSDFPRPFTPNFVPIGGILSHPIRPLPLDLKEFVEGSGKHGVIIFTLGSVVEGLGVREAEMAETFAKVFSKLPQRVLWRHKARPPASLGKNTRLVNWLPQNDLLGNAKTRLLIYHGGSNGVAEAIYHGVPMIIIPLAGDQLANAARVQKKGMGLILDKMNITEENLMSVVREVLDNPSYKERAQHYSAIQRDDPVTPLERAVYWLEHVMKFGDAHLRPRSADMGVIELYQIDVIVFLLIITFVVLYIDYVLVRKCYSACCGEQKTKETKNKSD